MVNGVRALRVLLVAVGGGRQFGQFVRLLHVLLFVRVQTDVLTTVAFLLQDRRLLAVLRRLARDRQAALRLAVDADALGAVVAGDRLKSLAGQYVLAIVV